MIKKYKKLVQKFGGLKIMPYLCTRKQGTTSCNTGKSCTACSLGTPPGLDRSKGTWL
jgi:hypothetical protein